MAFEETILYVAMKDSDRAHLLADSSDKRPQLKAENKLVNCANCAWLVIN